MINKIQLRKIILMECLPLNHFEWNVCHAVVLQRNDATFFRNAGNWFSKRSKYVINMQWVQVSKGHFPTLIIETSQCGQRGIQHGVSTDSMKLQVKKKSFL